MVMLSQTRSSTGSRVLGLNALLTIAAFSLGQLIGPAFAADRDGSGGLIVNEGAPVTRVVVTINKSRTFTVGRQFARAVVGSADHADVLPLSDRSIYIQGKKAGTTNVSLFDNDARLIGVLDVEVVLDTVNLQEKVRTSTGSQGIRVSSTNGRVVLSGMAQDAVTAERAVQVAKSLAAEQDVVNALQVAPSQQVMLEVRFLEASREAGRELGVNWAANVGGRQIINTGRGIATRNPSTGITTTTREQSQRQTASTFPTIDSGTLSSQGGSSITESRNGTAFPLLSTAGTLVGAGLGGPFGSVLANVLTNGGTSIDVLVTALEEKGVVRRLAEPNLIALSGDEARFLAGGEFPVPIASSGIAGTQTVTIQFKRFGVELKFKPTVLSRGIINLHIEPSVSELDFTNAVTISGTVIPALTKRDASTTVELRDGQSFAIAGLLASINQNQLAQVPWLGTVPVLGALFRSAAYQQKETDLVIIVTPRLVAPAAPGQRMASPLDTRLPANDVDFFLMGQPEVKKEFSDYIEKGGELKGPYGHMIRPEWAAPVAPKKP